MRIASYCLVTVISINAAFAQNHLESSSGNGYLRGWISLDSLYRAAPEFRPAPDAYQPRAEALRLLRRYDEPLTVLVFFGNWCGDSKREMPKFFSVLDLAKNKNFSVHLFGLDRSKKDEAGLAEAFNIAHVPTFIFLRSQRDFSLINNALNDRTANEFGRIVEAPTFSIEQDWVDILKNNPEWPRKLELEQQFSVWLIAIALNTFF
jgi:thiol-disulfide isomerase/thioredoxin